VTEAVQAGKKHQRGKTGSAGESNVLVPGEKKRGGRNKEGSGQGFALHFGEVKGVKKTRKRGTKKVGTAVQQGSRL